MRHLGQHFLKNKAAIKKIVAALDLAENDTVIEIGPGHGELTNELLKHPIRLIAIEKDWQLAQKLTERFGVLSFEFTVIEGDILKELPKLISQQSTGNSKLKTVNYKLIGNIPYYITGHLFRVIGELENKPTVAVLTIQKEVGERLTAAPPKMNRLAASVQIWAEVRIIAKIPAKDFDPPPEVESVLVKLKTKDHYSNYDRSYYSKYYKMVRILFQQPRKTLLNNLSSSLASLRERSGQDVNFSKEEIREKLGQINLSGEERPQNLSVDQIVEIAQLLSTI